jgi:hypothetical protein
MSTAIYGQTKTSKVIVAKYIKLPADSLVRKQLLNSFDKFLLAAQKPNEENELIFPAEKIETFIQLDEVNGIEKTSSDDKFFKPYLTNVAPIENNNYLMKVSYTGIKDTVPMTSGSFEFIAHKTDNSFLFSSPLLRNTKTWKTITLGNNVFHYQTTINQTKLKEFDRLATAFDKKLKSTNKKCEFYLCTDLPELQKVIGVDYKLAYNGRSESVWSSSLGDKKIIVSGNHNASFDNFDQHDLWHDRLSLVIPRSQVNKPVDEGCAYLYGGSWGLTWKEIFKEFKEKIANNKDANWVEIKENPIYFKTKEFNNSADYIVNALLVQKIEKEKGFDGIWEFLNCGPYAKGNENYYKALEKLTGITKANYNEKVWELINKLK